MNSKPPRLIVSLLVIAATLAVASPAFANQWSSIPELESNEYLAIPRAFDGPRYDSLRECLADMNSVVDAQYLGAIVAITDPGGQRSRDHDDATEYAKFAAGQWEEEGRFDLDRDIAVVYGVHNRSLGIYVGERWKKLGIDDQALSNIVDASTYSTHMGRHRFDNALCVLSEAIDHRLALLDVESRQKADRAEKLFFPAVERFSSLQSRVEDSLADDHPLQASLLETLAAAQPLLDADDDLEEAPQNVIEAAGRIEEITDDVEATLDRYHTRIEPLDELEEDIAATLASIETRDDRSWEGPTSASETLAQCQTDAEAARRSEEPDLLAIQACLHDARAELARSDVRHFYLARALPAGGALLFALVALTFVVARLRRRRRALQFLGPDLTAWTAGIERAEDKIERLETDFSWYFDGRNQFWKGESADTDRSIADGINRAFLLKTRGRALLDEADALHSKSKLINVGKLEKALRTLRASTITIESGHEESDRPLSLPITERLEVEASQLFDELDAAYFSARDGLEQAAPTQKQIASLIAQGKELQEGASAQIEERHRRGLPVDHLQKRLAQAAQAYDQAVQRAQELPEQGQQALDEALQSLESVQTRAADGNRVLDRVDDQVTELHQRVTALLESANSQGIDPDEPGFEPATIAAAAEDRSSEIVELVSAGREEEAQLALQPLVEELEQTAIRLSACIEGNDLVPEMLDTIESATPKIKEPLFHIRMHLKRHAPDDAAYDQHAAEIARLQKLMPRIERFLKKINSTQADGKKLTSIADLAALAKALESGARSLSAVQQLMDAPDDADGISPPAQPLWQAPENWNHNAAYIWGCSSDARDFCSLSLPETKSAPRHGHSASTVS